MVQQISVVMVKTMPSKKVLVRRLDYSLLSAVEVDTLTGKVKLVELRNPGEMMNGNAIGVMNPQCGHLN